MTSYNKNVDKKMKKLENILKLLAMNNEQFMENFKSFIDEESPDAEKLMILKGIKKADYLQFLGNIFKKWVCVYLLYVICLIKFSTV